MISLPTELNSQRLRYREGDKDCHLHRYGDGYGYFSNCEYEDEDYSTLPISYPLTSLPPCFFSTFHFFVFALYKNFRTRFPKFFKKFLIQILKKFGKHITKFFPRQKEKMETQGWKRKHRAGKRKILIWIVFINKFVPKDFFIWICVQVSISVHKKYLHLVLI
jgi:hypothetical protein